MTTIGGISTLVLILVLSLAIERVIRAFLFILSFLSFWVRWFPEPYTLKDPVRRLHAERKQKLIYFVLAGILGLVIVTFYGNVRILKALGYVSVNAILDIIATGIILIAGSDFISKLLQISGVGSDLGSSSQPIEITGRLILENSSVTKPEEQKMNSVQS